MPLIVGRYYRGKPGQKPRQWGPVSSVCSGVQNYCENVLGVESPAMLLPVWKGAGLPYNYGSNPQQIDPNGILTSTTGMVWTSQGIRSTINGTVVEFEFPTGFEVRENIAPATLWAELDLQVRGDADPVQLGLNSRASNRSYALAQSNSADYRFNVSWHRVTSGWQTYGSNVKSMIITSLAVDDHYIYCDGNEWLTDATDTSYALDYDYKYFQLMGTDDGPWGIKIAGWWNCGLTADQSARLSDDPYGMIQPYAPTIYSFPSASAGGTTYQTTASDGFDMGESLARIATLQGAASDGLNAGESIGKTAQMLAASVDGAQLSDIGARIATLLGSASDGAVLSDTGIADVGLFITATDGVSIGDQSSANAQLKSATIDGVSLGDSIAVAAALVALAVDGADLSDAAAADTEGIFEKTVTDGISMSENVASRAGFLSAVADAFDLSDTALTVLSMIVTAEDGISLSDLAAVVSGLISVTALDEFTVSDSGAVRADFTVTTSDGATFADAVSAVMTLTALATDAFNLGDAAIHILAQGVVSVSFSLKKAQINFTIKSSRVTFTSH